MEQIVPGFQPVSKDQYRTIPATPHAGALPAYRQLGVDDPRLLLGSPESNRDSGHQKTESCL
jgi:hypothetical protein